ncbi:MAG: hypothetical protein WCJ49_00360 [Deltaproteobacteria bacterium]
MPSIRVNISLPETIYNKLTKEVPVRGRSSFIAMAISKVFTEKRDGFIAQEYREASQEIMIAHKDMEGTLNDGL